MVFSSVCMIAAYSVLKYYDNKVAPHFIYGMALNTIVSILATAPKVSLTYTISNYDGIKLRGSAQVGVTQYNHERTTLGSGNFCQCFEGTIKFHCDAISQLYRKFFGIHRCNHYHSILGFRPVHVADHDAAHDGEGK